MLANILRRNEEKKADVQRQTEKAQVAAKEIQKTADAQKVKLFFEEVKVWVAKRIKEGACTEDLTIKLSYSSNCFCGKTHLGDIYKLLTDYSYAFKALFTQDEIFSPLYKLFEAWCEEEGLEVKWVYKKRDYSYRSSHSEEDESYWSLVFSVMQHTKIEVS